MKFEHQDFIGVFKGAFSQEFCSSVIDEFEYLIEHQFGYDRQRDGVTKKHQKNDLSYSINYDHGEDVELDLRGINSKLGKEFNTVFWRDCYPKYADEFSILKDLDTHAIYGNKIQKTNVGGGYHLWHSEAMTRQTSVRVMSYIVYLNNVEDGGETEFLYQSKRVNPEAGTMVLFPAAYTHTHRGNPPLSSEKYIITGWVEF